MWKSVFSLLIFIGLCTGASAQELNCTVKVLGVAIKNVDKKVFSTLEKSVSDFLNTRKWTKDEFNVNEKINVNLLLNLTSKSADKDIYNATLTIQASRPVFNTSYSSPTVNFVDRDVVFKYSEYGTLQFDENRISGSDPLAANLTAILAYYAYIIIGIDYDSFSPNGGTNFYMRAQNIVNNAPEDGKSIPGWKAVEGNKNRYWLVDQLLSPRFQEVRNYYYTLHRQGLDNLYAHPEAARLKILGGIPKLSQVNNDNPGSLLIQFFFDAKSDELSKVVAQLPRSNRTQFVTMLSQMDVPNAAKYQSLIK